MKCPTPCICGEIVELDQMMEISGSLPTGGNLVCRDCYCEECHGTGEVIDDEYWTKYWRGKSGDEMIRCPKCDGLGYLVGGNNY